MCVLCVVRCEEAFSNTVPRGSCLLKSDVRFWEKALARIGRRLTQNIYRDERATQRLRRKTKTKGYLDGADGAETSSAGAASVVSGETRPSCAARGGESIFAFGSPFLKNKKAGSGTFQRRRGFSRVKVRGLLRRKTRQQKREK